MKKLRFEAVDGEWRAAFAFDPQRQAILLVAGDKSGGSEKPFYRKLIAKADKRFSAHLDHLKAGKKEIELGRVLIRSLPSFRPNGGSVSRRAIGNSARTWRACESQPIAARRRRISRQRSTSSSPRCPRSKQADMYLSTLRSYVEAIGGELELTVKLPDCPPLRIHHLGDLAEPTVQPRTPAPRVDVEQRQPVRFGVTTVPDDDAYH